MIALISLAATLLDGGMTAQDIIALVVGAIDALGLTPIIVGAIVVAVAVGLLKWLGVLKD